MTGGGPRFALVAGEASGDLLGAGLVDGLRERFPDAEFAGIGGDAMRAAGMETWHDAGELAVMGLSEVLAHLPRLLRLRRGLRRRILDWKPDAFIGIDAPDFNLGLERQLKARGVCTVHYVSPSVWAWRQGRAAKIGRSADRVLCLFPMEPAIYARHGVDARFVGHPMADAMPLNPDRREGQKTAVFEVVEELGGPPDAFVLPYGGGGNTSSYAQALAELGLETPIVSVEAVKRRETLASAIRIGNPVHVEAVRSSGATVLQVTDDELVSAWKALATAEGLFCEPSSAAGLAAVLRGDVEGERLAVTITGHGLKDPALADRLAPPPVEVDPDPDAIVGASRSQMS